MTGARWQRWVLGSVVAGFVPIAIAGAGCSGQDDTPEASAGTPSSSGSAAGGSSAGNNTSGSAARGAAAGNPSAGGSAAGGSAAGGSAAGGSAAGGSAAGGSGGSHSNGGSASGGASCCTQGSADVCTEDGQQLKRCALTPGKACDGSGSMYVSVWQVQACPNGCGSAGGSGPKCK